MSKKQTSMITEIFIETSERSNIKYKLYSFEADLKTRKYGINPLFDCFHASYLPILMEIGTEVLIPKIAERSQTKSLWYEEAPFVN